MDGLAVGWGLRPESYLLPATTLPSLRHLLFMDNRRRPACLAGGGRELGGVAIAAAFGDTRPVTSVACLRAALLCAWLCLQ